MAAFFILAPFIGVCIFLIFGEVDYESPAPKVVKDAKGKLEAAKKANS